MKRQDAEKIITEYIKSIFGFALKRAKTETDAEDLSQEIVLRAYRALLAKDDIADVNKFIWTVAHHTLCNYYRDHAEYVIGTPLDALAEVLADPSAEPDIEDNEATVRRLQSEIAYLSALQRKIVVAYYFENRKQADIAKRLAIPLGTVKWHLFEAKKELKRGMDMTRKTSELKFNPIQFHSYGINGSIGKKNLDEFFRSAIAQNICYCVRNKAKSVAEIADDLGVSPVYVENEVEHLEKYSYLLEKNGKYIVNFLISEQTADFLTMQNAMYQRAAAPFANELFDELTKSGILDDPDIVCGQSDEPHNFLLWSLIPYIAARSGEHLMEEKITFDEVATMRADGAHNICLATIIPEHMTLPEDYVYMKNWCGPCWIYKDHHARHTFWSIDTEWSGRRFEVRNNTFRDMLRVIELYERDQTPEHLDRLSQNEYAFLAELGFIKLAEDPEGDFHASWQIVSLKNTDIRDRLLAIGNKLKEKYLSEWEMLKKPYVEAVLDCVPTHLRKMKEYELQFLFHSDGWFLCHCIHALLRNGKLKPPTEAQRKALTTLIVPKQICFL